MSDDVVDVAEEEKEEAPIVTVAHTIEAIPSPPRSPFRFVAIYQFPSLLCCHYHQIMTHTNCHHCQKCKDHDDHPGLSFQTSQPALEPSQLSPSSLTNCSRYIFFVGLIIIIIDIIISRTPSSLLTDSLW